MSLFDKLSKLAGLKSTSRTVKYERESTKVWVDGKEVEAGDVDLDLLRELRQFGVTADDLTSTTDRQRPHDVSRRAARELAEVQAKGPAARVECPACERTVVNRTGSCMYCGAALVDEATEAIETNLVDQAHRSDRHEVDKQFLDADVEAADRDAEASNEDAYLHRLRRM